MEAVEMDGYKKIHAIVTKRENMELAYKINDSLRYWKINNYPGTDT